MSGHRWPTPRLLVALAALCPAALGAEADAQGGWREETFGSLRSLTLYDMSSSGPLTEEELAVAVPRVMPAAGRGSSGLLPNIGVPSASAVGSAGSLARSGRKCVQPSPITSFTDYPQKAIGKIFYRAGNGSWACSGAFLGDVDLVMTAGHCCYDKQDEGWGRDWEVWLGFHHEGGRLKGERYRVQAASVNAAWYRQRNFMYDWCFLKMHSRGPTYLDYRANFGASDLSALQSYGYPRNFGQGRILQEDHGYVGRLYKDPDGSGLLSSECIFMRKGCSGGPWISQGHAVGLNSFVVSDTMFSPYFGDPWLTNCRQVGGCNSSRRLRGLDGSSGPGGSSSAPLLA